MLTCPLDKWVWDLAARCRSAQRSAQNRWGVLSESNGLRTHKARIEVGRAPLWSIQGPVGALREATVSATVSEMDEGGNTGREEPVQAR